MINTELFAISSDRSKIDINIIGVESDDSIYLYRHTNYGDTSKAINLMDYFDDVDTIEASLTPQNFGQTYFDGMYILQIEELGQEIKTSIEYDFTKYEECLLNKTLNLSTCDSCLKNISSDLVNASALLESLQYAVKSGFLFESIEVINTLDKYCSNECKSCGNYANESYSEYYKSFVKTGSNVDENPFKIIISGAENQLVTVSYNLNTEELQADANGAVIPTEKIETEYSVTYRKDYEFNGQTYINQLFSGSATLVSAELQSELFIVVSTSILA